MIISFEFVLMEYLLFLKIEVALIQSNPLNNKIEIVMDISKATIGFFVELLANTPTMVYTAAKQIRPK